MIRRHTHKENLYLLIDGSGAHQGVVDADKGLKEAIRVAKGLNKNPNFGTWGMIKIYPQIVETKTIIKKCVKTVR